MTSSDDLTEPFVELIRRASTDLPADVEVALRAAHAREGPASAAAGALATILENVALARANSTPICQDTGVPIFYVFRPQGMSTRELQAQIEEANTVIQALETERDLAREEYRSLERKLSESMILAESVPAGAALGWQDTPPTKFAGPITWRNTVLAGALGLCISILFAFMMEYVSPRRPAPQTK